MPYTLQPEVSNPSEGVVSGWTKNTQKPNFFFEKRKKILGKRCFYHALKGQISQKKLFFVLAILHHFQTKMFKSETTSFNYFSKRIPNL